VVDGVRTHQQSQIVQERTGTQLTVGVLRGWWLLVLAPGVKLAGSGTYCQYAACASLCALLLMKIMIGGHDALTSRALHMMCNVTQMKTIHTRAVLLLGLASCYWANGGG
jgi:hypothetical protein